MKRFCILLSILAILNMGVSIADAQRWIPDTNLRTAVRETLDLADGARLTKAAMRRSDRTLGDQRQWGKRSEGFGIRNKSS